MRRFLGPLEMPTRRMPGAIWAALRHNILPAEYYAYALWKPERRANIDSYLYSHEAARIFKCLNRPSQTDPIIDKLAFFEMCRAQAIPTPTVLAAFAPTGISREFESGAPPECDLFIKPRFGLAGHGAERFRWRGGAFQSECGRRLSGQDLVDHLLDRARSEKRILLVQPNLTNHPDLGVEPNGALATARLVTGLASNGDVVAIFGFIYFARSDKITAQHGHVSLIDIASGRLASPTVQSGSRTNNSNPQADNRTSLLTLPDWETALRYAKIAHRLCANIAFVGWDIAFNRDGPVLLEGNANWSADEYQALTGNPLGHTKFATVLAARLLEGEKSRNW
jgi:glutathione synthase/RimK-type ligase-like ATP-grasp enzyme